MSSAVLTELSKLQQENVELRSQNTALAEKTTKLERELDHKKYVIEKLRALLRGKRSEKIRSDEILPGMLDLFTAEELAEIEDATGIDPRALEPALPEPEPRARKLAGRPLIPDDLPRAEIRHELAPEERHCPTCDLVMDEVATKVEETLDVIPAKVFVKKTVCCLYGCRHCDNGQVFSAKKPLRAVEKGLAEPGLLAHVVVSKFADHLPFYRQSLMFGRQGIHISDSTLCDWSGQVADVLAPVVWVMKRRMLKGGYLQSDDTTLRVLDPMLKGKSHLARLWAYCEPKGEVIYDYTRTRSRDGPLEFLEGFEGKLQADAYSGYKEVIAKRSLTHFGCWAHARRYFHEAVKDFAAQANKAIHYIRLLYAIEDQARAGHLSHEARLELREQKAPVVLKGLKEYLDALLPSVLPKSAIGQAVQYAIKQWVSLAAYVHDGQVEIDNNACEQSMRPVAIGRKNYLFAGSDSGGERAAVLYSVVESAKRLKINPHEYVKDVLTRIRSHPLDRLDELTPAGWKTARVATT